MSAGSLSFAHGLLATGVGDAVVLSKTSPALTVLVASFWLGDKLRVHDIISVRLCCVLDLPLPPFHCHSCLSTVFSLSFHCRQVLLCLGGVALITQSSVEEPVADTALADGEQPAGVAAAAAGGLGADGAWQENVRAAFLEHTLLGGLLSHNASMHATMPAPRWMTSVSNAAPGPGWGRRRCWGQRRRLLVVGRDVCGGYVYIVGTDLGSGVYKTQPANRIRYAILWNRCAVWSVGADHVGVFRHNDPETLS